MGETKRKEEAAKVAQIIHFPEQEMFFILQACNSRIQTRDHLEGRKLDRAFEQLKLDAFEDVVQAKIKAAGTTGINLRKDLDSKPVAYELDIPTVEFLLEKLKPLVIESNGLASRILSRVCARLIQVVEGRYVSPDSVSSTSESASV